MASDIKSRGNARKTMENRGVSIASGARTINARATRAQCSCIGAGPWGKEKRVEVSFSTRSWGPEETDVPVPRTSRGLLLRYGVPENQFLHPEPICICKTRLTSYSVGRRCINRARVLQRLPQIISRSASRAFFGESGIPASFFPFFSPPRLFLILRFASLFRRSDFTLSHTPVKPRGSPRYAWPVDRSGIEERDSTVGCHA